MKRSISLLSLGLVLAVGCAREEKQEPAEQLPAVEQRQEIRVGDTYEQVIDKLGKPNIESETQNSLVLIYDQVEVKLQTNLVVEVFDHRAD